MRGGETAPAPEGLSKEAARVLFDVFDVCPECAQNGFHMDGDPPFPHTCWPSREIGERWYAALRAVSEGRK